MAPPAGASRLVFIAGAAHSGSTVLEMWLTTGRRAVGVGEAWTALSEPAAVLRQRRCSCGAWVADCALWAPVVEATAARPGAVGRADGYALLLDRVRALYGETTTIDSSKRPEALDALSRALPAVDVRVVHNVRDVRGHATSLIDKARREGRRPELPELIFYRWYARNRRVHAAAVRLFGRPPVRITHEDLCLATADVASRLAGALGADYADPAAALNAGILHSVKGNRVRLPEHADRAGRLTYDDRWRSRSEWRRPYWLLPMVRAYNERCRQQP